LDRICPNEPNNGHVGSAAEENAQPSSLHCTCIIGYSTDGVTGKGWRLNRVIFQHIIKKECADAFCSELVEAEQTASLPTESSEAWYQEPQLSPSVGLPHQLSCRHLSTGPPQPNNLILPMWHHCSESQNGLDWEGLCKII